MNTSINNTISINSISLDPLQLALDSLITNLQVFATSPDFSHQMALTFGEADTSSYQTAWTTGNIDVPIIQIVPSESINRANGAFSRDTGHIYLASEFVRGAGISDLTNLLTEEYGHFIDAQLNSTETIGDEGEIFANLVQGNPINPTAFTEDDTATVTLEGQTITIEQGNPIVYVNLAARGSNNGTSWANAYTSLATALTNAPVGSEIWVAQGTYKPTTTIDRDISFDLKNLVEVYGGFNGTETSRVQRNWVANPTVLSGDIGVPNDKSDNSYNVVAGSGLSASTVLDGFTITDGNNTQSGGDGAGIYLNNSSSILSNLHITNNSASNDGGGGYIRNGIPQLTNVTFSGNTSQYGGGLLLSSSNTILNYVNFYGNSATEQGGALYINGSNPIITNSNFTSNTATNSGSDGGAIFIYQGSPQLTNVRFVTNSANDTGGGIATGQGYGDLSNPVLLNAVFERNSSNTGGGIYFGEYLGRGGSPTLTNVVFDRNTGNIGGAIYNIRNRATLTNITFSNNTAATGSAIISNGDISQVSVTNSIFWNDQATIANNIITNADDGRTLVNNSLVQGGYLSSDTNKPNLDVNPLFVDATSGNLRLRGLSPAINIGSNDAVNGITTDVAGVPRIVAGTVDLGAYEFTIDPAQYGASYGDLITNIGYNLPVLEGHYYNSGRFEGRSADNFDEYRYIASNPDLISFFGLNGAGATYHYITAGYFEGRSLSAFDPARYLDSYDDLLNYYGTNTLAATQHYITSGFREGRNPNLFPSDRYIASYPDLIQTYRYNLEAGSNHYLYSGRAEGRSVTFDPISYLNKNPDVNAAYNGDLNGATQHYILYGFNEGRTWI